MVAGKSEGVPVPAAVGPPEPVATKGSVPVDGELTRADEDEFSPKFPPPIPPMTAPAGAMPEMSDAAPDHSLTKGSAAIAQAKGRTNADYYG